MLLMMPRLFKGEQMLDADFHLVAGIAAILVPLISFIVEGGAVNEEGGTVRQAAGKGRLLFGYALFRGDRQRRDCALAVMRQMGFMQLNGALPMNDFSQDKEGEQRGCRQPHPAYHVHSDEEQDGCHLDRLLS